MTNKTYDNTWLTIFSVKDRAPSRLCKSILLALKQKQILFATGFYCRNNISLTQNDFLKP